MLSQLPSGPVGPPYLTNVRCKEMASRNFAVANTILVAGVSEPWSLPTNLCEIEECGRLLNCTLSMDVFSLIRGPVVFHRTASNVHSPG
ncbi:hypothetical protein AYI69_g7528, partial [Smittium culicis]